MTIDIKNFDYEILGFDQRRPQLLGQPAFHNNSIVNYDFTHRQLDRGFELTVTSQIQIPLHQKNDILLFQGSSTYLIPSEQHISRAADRLQEIDTTVYMEFLFQHLSRQTSIIYADTFNNYPETNGYIVKVPTLYDLNQTPLNN